MKPVFRALGLLLLLPVAVHSQSGSINNTLGTGGTFTIKDGSTTFLSLTQSDGKVSLNKTLTLPVTTGSSIGVILKGSNRFIHDYKASGTSGSNTFVGVNAGNFTMSGTGSEASCNTAVGNSSLSSITTGRFNSAFGYTSLNSNTTGQDNSAFGSHSLDVNTTGYSNSAFGSSSLGGNTTGYSNSAFGSNSLSLNTTGNENAGFGSGSLYLNSTGNENSAFGFSSLLGNTTGYQNSAFGSYSQNNNTTGKFNSAFGSHSLLLNTTGHSNSAFGYSCLLSNTTGFRNTAIGNKSLYSNTTGWHNTAIGDSSLYLNTGNYNTAVGFNAGSQVTSGANLTLIGIDANPSAGDALDEITLGNIFVGKLRCNVTTITALSDLRDKKNIRDLSLGLDFLMKVRPRQFNWDRRDWYEDGKPDGSKMKKEPTAGFIAQEFDEVQTQEGAEWLNLVLKSNPDRLEATPGNLLPVMVKAIQELKAENDALRNELSAIRASLADVQKALTGKLSLNEPKE